MSKTPKRRLPADVLQADLDCITALKMIKGYTPSNPADTLEAIEAIQTRVTAAEDHEFHLGNSYAAARDDTTDLQHLRHDRVKSIKNQIRAQFGDDSNEVAAIGLKKSSERKPPKRQSRTDGNGG